MDSSLYYLLLNLGSISVPLIRSFEPRINYVSKWPGLFLGMVAMSLIFIPWDVGFTHFGVWGFNPVYLTGLTIINLPIEEWMFFFAIPYACIFIYETLNYFIQKDVLGKAAPYISAAYIAVILPIGLMNTDKLYTSITFISTGVVLAIVAFALKPKYLGRFYLGYIISVIPFLAVNGILTGSWIEDQIVWYNNAENLSIRIGTIPVEDTVYMLLMLLITTVVYEWWKARKGIPTP